MNTNAEKYKDRKRSLLKNYIIIGIVFLLTIALNTYFIRNLYYSIHLSEVTKEAKGVAEYAKSRFTAYNAIDLLVDLWEDTEMNMPDDTQAGYFSSKRDSLMLTSVTPEELMNMDYGERTAYLHSNYMKLASGFDLIYKTFDVESLYCVKYTDEGPRLLFIGDEGSDTVYHLPENILPANTEKYEDLRNDPKIMSGEGRMTTVINKGGTEMLRFTLPISSNENHLFVIIWERDWSSVANEINRGALQISLLTGILLLAIFIGVVLIYRKHGLELIRAGIEKERSKAELDVCRRIQLSQLPDPGAEFSGRSDVDVSVLVSPAREVGGDFCDCFMIGKDKIGLVIADVSDKGLPAAMFMMTAKSLIRSDLVHGISPEQAMENVNRQLCEHNGAIMFVTVWLAVIDLVTGECTAVNAGHENPAIKRNGESWEFLKYPHDTPVSLFRDAIFIKRSEKLSDGDMIFVYTDGVTEARNVGDELFGEERLIKELNGTAFADTKAVIDGIMERINSFSEGTEQYDDIGMVCFRYRSRAAKNITEE